MLFCYISRYSKHPSVAMNSLNAVHDTFSFSCVISNEIYKFVMNMNTEKSTGYHNIPAKLLKIEAAPMAGILSHLFNVSIKQCLCSDELKFADVAAKGCVKDIITQSISLYLFLKHSKVHSVNNSMDFSTSFYWNCSLGSKRSTVVERLYSGW